MSSYTKDYQYNQGIQLHFISDLRPLTFVLQVTFQIAIDQAGIKQRAMNVTSVRDLCKGKVESVKGQVGHYY